MKKKIFVSTLFLTLFSGVLLAQKNYLPGFVVLTGGEKKTGLIDYRNWERNPKKITFRSSESAPEEEFTVQQLSAFEIVNTDVYTRAIVWKDMQSVDLNSLEQHVRPKVVDTVFLRSLVNGQRLSLFELVDNKFHYFIKPANDSIQELQYKVLLNSDDPTKYMAFHTYRNQLKQYAFDTPEQQKLMQQIEGVAYLAKDLTRIVKVINGHTPKTGEAPENKLKWRQFFIGAGLAQNTIDFKGEREELTILNESPSLGYGATVGIDLYHNRRFQNLFLRGELRMSTVRYKGEAEVASFWVGQREKKVYDLQMTLFTPTISAMYTVARMNSSKAYLGISWGQNLTRYTTNRYTTTNQTTKEVEVKDKYISFSNSWSDLLLNIGFITKKNLEARMLYRIDGAFSKFVGIEAKNKMVGIMVNYRF